MYSLVRLYIKTSAFFLFVALLLGGYLIFLRDVREVFPDSMLITAHTHLLLIGFVMMMIMGVALWMFPRPQKGDRRYSPDLARAVYWIMAVSTSVRFLGETIRAYVESSPLRWATALSGFAQIIAIALFFINIWARIRPVGSHIREAKGEKF